ncbi:ATP-grasp domain-containing protein [Paenibacillus sp. MY03]|uniref:ATP-grasp domain-containing protein n=1 Tax=Paenibacillus sp. MY03 TaxID=302980 RepID=UPI0015C68C3C|nr:ATP-grasp domain-containing protein [Paenibacillus sp. MY03]
MKKKIMILGASNLQLPAIIKGKEMGLEVIAVDMDVNAIGFNFADICINLSTLDVLGVIEVAQKYQINAIMTLASDMPMRTVAAVSESLKIVGITRETALNVTNKYLMRSVLKSKGVSVPSFYKAVTLDDYMNIIGSFSGKVIVKPADNSGSRGVFLIENIHNKKIVEYAFKYSKKYSRSGEIIIEEYMEGVEVSVEALTFEGKTTIIAITDKVTTGAPNFVEVGHTIPSQLSEEIKEQVQSITRKAIQSVGIINGPSHTEIIVTEAGPKIVEIGARLGGDNITTHLVPLATGIDIVEATIKIAMGDFPIISKNKDMAAAIRYFETYTGKITNIVGIEEARMLPGVVEIHLNKNKGEIVTEITSSTDRVGHVISFASSSVDAINRCNDVMNLIQFEIEKNN